MNVFIILLLTFAGWIAVICDDANRPSGTSCATNQLPVGKGVFSDAAIRRPEHRMKGKRHLGHREAFCVATGVGKYSEVAGQDRENTWAQVRVYRITR